MFGFENKSGFEILFSSYDYFIEFFLGCTQILYNMNWLFNKDDYHGDSHEILGSSTPSGFEHGFIMVQ